MPSPLNATTPIVDAPVVVAPVVVIPAPDLGVRPGLTRTKMCKKWRVTTNTWVDM